MDPFSTSSSCCPVCGQSLPADAVQGCCPSCLMAGAMQPTQTEGGAATLPALTPEELAPYFPQLEILECLGRGGMGVVYKARQKSLNRLVALKLLAPERADDPQFAARFEKEAHALAALNHPHIVGVHDFGVTQTLLSEHPTYFLLMEFVDGVNLRQLLQSKRLTPKEALSIVPPVCEALQCAHDHGIVHRDIKPENLLIDKAGVVKIADFGIAKMIAHESFPDPGMDSRTTFTLGTPDYVAPEQARGSADHRADIYSLGVVLYEMLTGERPGDKLEAPSKRVQVDVRIDEIVLKALEKTPELRFATAAEFRTQVESLGTTLTHDENAGPTQPVTRPSFSISRFSKWAGVTALVAGVMLLLGSSVLNEMVDDFGLTPTARKHLHTRQRMAEQWDEAKRAAAHAVARRDEAKKDSANREVFGKLVREAENYQRTARQIETQMNLAAAMKEAIEQQRIAQFYFVAGILIAAGLFLLFLGRRTGRSAPPAKSWRLGGLLLLGTVAIVVVLLLLRKSPRGDRQIPETTALPPTPALPDRAANLTRRLTDPTPNDAPAYRFGPWREAVLHYSKDEDRPHFQFATGKTVSIQERSAFLGETAAQARDRLKRDHADMCLEKDNGELIVKWHHILTLGRVPATLLDDRDSLEWNKQPPSRAAVTFERLGPFTDHIAYLIRTQNDEVFFVQLLKNFEEADGRRGIKFRYKDGQLILKNVSPAEKHESEKTTTIPFKGEPKMRYIAWMPKDASGWQLYTPSGEAVTAPGDIPLADWDWWQKSRSKSDAASKISDTSGWLMFFYSHPEIDNGSQCDLMMFNPEWAEINTNQRITWADYPEANQSEGWQASGCRVPYSVVKGQLKVRLGIKGGPWSAGNLIAAGKSNNVGAGQLLTNSGQDETGRAYVTVVTEDEDAAASDQWEVWGRLHDGSDMRSDGEATTVPTEDQYVHTLRFTKPLSSFAGFFIRSRERRTFNYDEIQVPPPPFAVQEAQFKSTLQMRWVSNMPSAETEPLTLAGRGQSETLHVEKAVVLDQSSLLSVDVTHRSKPEDSRVMLKFTESGKQRFAQATREGKGRRLAIVIDGQVLSAPVINTEITDGNAEISGNLNYEELDDLAARLRQAIHDGASPAPPKDTSSSSPQTSAESALQMRWVLDTPSEDTQELRLMGNLRQGGTIETVHVQKASLLDETALESVKVVKDAQAGTWGIEFEFTESGGKRFAELTRHAQGRKLAIVIDRKLYAAPVITGEIAGGRAVIHGNWSEQVTRALAAHVAVVLKVAKGMGKDTVQAAPPIEASAASSADWIFGPTKSQALSAEGNGVAPYFQFAEGKTVMIRLAPAASVEEIGEDWDKANAAGGVDFTLRHEDGDILIRQNGCAFGEWLTVQESVFLSANQAYALGGELRAKNENIRLAHGQWPASCLFRTAKGLVGLMTVTSVKQTDGKPPLLSFDYKLVRRLEDMPQTVDQFFQMGAALWEQRDFADVVRLYDEATKHHPKESGFFNNRANAHTALHHYEQAIADFSEALRLSPGNDNIYRSRAVAYHQMGNYDHALADLDLAVKASPEGVNYALRGRAHHAKGEFRNALADYEKGILATPGYTLTYLYLAWLLATCPDDTLRDAEKARQFASMSSRLLPDLQPETSATLAAAHAEMGDYASAIRHEQAALNQLPPGCEQAAQSKERLKLYQAHQPLRSPLPLPVDFWRR